MSEKPYLTYNATRTLWRRPFFYNFCDLFASTIFLKLNNQPVINIAQILLFGVSKRNVESVGKM